MRSILIHTTLEHWAPKASFAPSAHALQVRYVTTARILNQKSDQSALAFLADGALLIRVDLFARRLDKLHHDIGDMLLAVVLHDYVPIRVGTKGATRMRAAIRAGENDD